MKKTKQSKPIILAILFLFLLLTACSNTKNDTENSSTEEQASTAQTKIFTDSTGREVEVPAEIKGIAPSGPLAQIVLYTSAPDLLVGLAGDFSAEAKSYIPDRYLQLPEFGQFYGKNASLNMEALSAAQPDVIIDIGEMKKTAKEDMEKLQNQLNIPTVFIEANLESMDKTYKMLGELLGNEKENQKLSQYCQAIIQQAEEAKKALPDNELKSVYYAAGNAGLNTNAAGSFHAQVFDMVGAENVVTGVEAASQGSGTVISLEQLIQWQPDYILAESEAVYQMILKEEAWQELEAVKEQRVYKIPTAPYNFLGFPPSVNRILGIEWLGNLLYPEYYQLDINEQVTEFYSLFYHYDLKEKELKTILKNAE